MRLAFILILAATIGAPCVAAAASPETRLLAGVAARVPTDVHTEVVRRPAVSEGFEILEVLGSARGVPFDRPLARALAQGRTGAMTMPVAPIRVRDLPLVDAVLHPEEAAAFVEQSRMPGSRGAERAQLIWSLRPDGSARLGWRVDPPPDLEHLTDPTFFVDDATGRVIVLQDDVLSASVRAYPANPVKTPEVELFELSTLPASAATLVGEEVEALTCVEPIPGVWFGVPNRCELDAIALADPEGDFVFEPAPDGTVFDDAFAEASAYLHAERFLSAMHDLGLGPLRCEQLGGRTTIVANYRGLDDAPHANAHYQPLCEASILLGQSSSRDAAYDGDVVAHELGHAVVHTVCGHNLNQSRRRPEAFVRDALAINEAIADFLSSVHYGDPVFSEYFFDSTRDLDNDRSCPASLSNFVHDDGLILGGALWRLHEQIGTDIVAVLLDAVSLVPQDASFEEITASLIAVADAELGSEAARLVTAELESRGLHDCPRLVPLVDEHLFVLASQYGFQAFAPPPLQYVIDVPDDAEAVKVRVVAVVESTASLRPTNLLFRQGQPVAFTYGEDAPQSVEAEIDDAVTDVQGMSTVTHPVTPGVPLYVAIANTELEWLVGTIVLEGFERSTEEDGDGGTTSSAGSSSDDGSPQPPPYPMETDTDDPPGQRTDDAGCGCRSTQPDPLGALLLFLLPYFGIRRSRRHVPQLTAPSSANVK